MNAEDIVMLVGLIAACAGCALVAGKFIAAGATDDE